MLFETEVGERDHGRGYVDQGFDLIAGEAGPRREGESGPCPAGEESARPRTSEPNEAWTGHCARRCLRNWRGARRHRGATVLRAWLPRASSAGSVREKSVPVAVGAGVVGRPDGSGLRRGAADRGWPWLLASVTASFCLGSRGRGPGGVSLS